MTNSGGDTDSTLRSSIQRIDQDHPLTAPLNFNQTHIAPRLERLEAKVAFFVEYIDYLERRIDALESRQDQDGGSGAPSGGSA